MNQQPIAMFDSGVGGLTVLKELISALPFESVVYFGDTARVPYGNKSRETIIRYSIENSRFLLEFNPKLLIIACNTASAFALDELQNLLSIPVIGVIDPAVNDALKATRSGKIGVIATRGTIGSNVYQSKLLAADPSLQVFARPCPLFVPFIEEGRIDHPMTHNLIEEYLSPLLESNIDTLILGCTHYPLLSQQIQDYLGNDIRLIHSGRSTAHSARLLIRATEESAGGLPPQYQFFTSDDPDNFAHIGTAFLGNQATIRPTRSQFAV
jgi:glutamate racemase